MPGFDHVAGGAGVDDDRVLQHLLELADAGLVEAVLVLGRVVVGVLLDVAVLAGPLDRERELPPARRGAFFQFRLQPLVGLGREVGLGHGGQGTSAGRRNPATPGVFRRDPAGRA